VSIATVHQNALNCFLFLCFKHWSEYGYWVCSFQKKKKKKKQEEEEEKSSSSLCVTFGWFLAYIYYFLLSLLEPKGVGSCSSWPICASYSLQSFGQSRACSCIPSFVYNENLLSKRKALWSYFLPLFLLLWVIILGR
jgi:hypothetical protein